MKKSKHILLLFSCVIVVVILYFGMPTKQQRDPNLLVVGTSLDYPPYEFVDKATGQAVGLDIDLVREIALKLNKKLDIQDKPFTSLIFGLLSNDVDLLVSGMTPTKRRARLVAFTKPYLQGKPLVIFSKISRCMPKSIQDLQGKVVAVNTGYIADMYMSKQPGVELIKLTSPADCFMAVQAGSVDAFVCNQNAVQDFLKHTAHPEQFAMVQIPDTQEVCACAVNKNNPTLLQEVNQALDAMIADGSLDQIKQKWGF